MNREELKCFFVLILAICGCGSELAADPTGATDEAAINNPLGDPIDLPEAGCRRVVENFKANHCSSLFDGHNLQVCNDASEAIYDACEDGNVGYNNYRNACGTLEVLIIGDDEKTYNVAAHSIYGELCDGALTIAQNASDIVRQELCDVVYADDVAAGLPPSRFYAACIDATSELALSNVSKLAFPHEAYAHRPNCEDLRELEMGYSLSGIVDLICD